jgi:hypothetical protein
MMDGAFYSSLLNLSCHIANISDEDIKIGRGIFIISIIDSHENWINDPDYQKATIYRHQSSTMARLLVQEGGENTQDPDPKL